MKVVDSKLSGCYEIFPELFHDERGQFVKTFHSRIFEKHNLCTDFKEEYYSISAKNVIRGLHFDLVKSNLMLIFSARFWIRLIDAHNMMIHIMISRSCVTYCCY